MARSVGGLENEKLHRARMSAPPLPAAAAAPRPRNSPARAALSGDAASLAGIQPVVRCKKPSPVDGAMPVRRSPSLHLPGLLSALAMSLLHLCVVNKNNRKVLGSRQSNPRDSKHLRGFVSKATSCLLAAKGHGNEGSLWKMNSSMTTTTKKSAGERIREGGVFRGGGARGEE